jgi:thioredoxin 1
MTRQPSGKQWIYDVNVRDFDSRVLDASGQRPVLVDFRAQWCVPCLVIAPVLAQLVGKYGGALQLAKVEVDVGENMKLAGRYRVRDFIRQHGGI